MEQHQTVRRPINDRPLVTLGWRVIGLAKSGDGIRRTLQYLSRKLFTSKAAAEEMVRLANLADPEIRAYIAETKGHDDIVA